MKGKKRLDVFYLIEAKAAEGSLLWQEVAESGRAADVGRVGWVALHKTVGTQRGREGRATQA